jgi:hypothetical protein
MRGGVSTAVTAEQPWKVDFRFGSPHKTLLTQRKDRHIPPR